MMEDHPVNGLSPLSIRRAQLLIVDDNPINIGLLNSILIADYDVFMAACGREALEMCRNAPPDLVLLDVMMPDIDGLEVCRQLKHHPETAEIPVIFVTAGCTPADEDACWDAGCVDFVTKPINPATLLNRVRAHLKLKFHVDALKAMAFVDGLTGIPNRRFFDEILDAEWRRSARGGTCLSLLMIDVDFFKHYNDRYGHLVGDDCLRRIASLLRGQLNRPFDVVARYGGEEFACLLPGNDQRGALAFAELLERSIRTAGIEHLDLGLNDVVTVSVGVAVAHPTRDTSYVSLVQRADAALYRAKHLGRGRAYLDVSGDLQLEGGERKVG